MLATNLLKKDIVSSSLLSISLPLVTLPHIVTPSLAMSLLADLQPRLSHSNPSIRKKAVVCLYRVALVYPEALKLTWPKIKDCLMDNQEDSSVTAAIINVVCELGWRRPHDFLPLAPRFFELLMHSGNNWMAIKIIKLVSSSFQAPMHPTSDARSNPTVQFATLIPLEPRLIRKLIRPLTNIIQTTTAMSLLYECINGMIQGGMLDGIEGVHEVEEIVGLCVTKLRGMILMDADPNLKYVALLAFNRIVISHPALVSIQQDVIVNCLEDADVSIRLQALDLAVGMVSSDTLPLVVNRLVTQLRNSHISTHDSDVGSKAPTNATHDGTEDSYGHKTPQTLHFPDEYRSEVVRRILDLCSRDNYSNIHNFEWYVDILVQLSAIVLPSAHGLQNDVGSRIGAEIRSIAIRVISVRLEVTRAAESLVLMKNRTSAGLSTSPGILGPAAWVVGEFADYLAFPDRTLDSLIDMTSITLPPRILSLYLQAIPKLLVCSNNQNWKSSKQSEFSLILARVLNFLEALATHPDLDVQERAVEFLELLRLAKDALCGPANSQVPPLLSSIIPSLFVGLDLKPVSSTAQKKVPLPVGLDLGQPINNAFHSSFSDSYDVCPEVADKPGFESFYYGQDTSTLVNQQEPMKTDAPQTGSYQDSSEILLDGSIDIAKRKAERRERNKDDPFYIDPDGEPFGSNSLFHQALTTSNEEELDIESIPIINLTIDDGESSFEKSSAGDSLRKNRSSASGKVDIVIEETLGDDEYSAASIKAGVLSDKGRSKRSVLQVDSSGLEQLLLEDVQLRSSLAADIKVDEQGDIEMSRAVQEVENLRLQMQRAAERIHAHGVPTEGTLIKKKKRSAGRSHRKSRERVRTNNKPTVDNSILDKDVDAARVDKRKKRPDI
ncbi:hypothetical protein Egran_06073 [Elaphomyces granulatus]|uniref:AP-3 complex subunit delta n=1 Tax=Elaphomyces granulatus TaxID=519963 RepID=A0A232LPU9_9EURO|nr:hypothetical protein Egran_06073 [Elaphomyces granulatus]